MAVIPNSDIQLATDIGQVLNSAGGSVDVNQPLTYFTESAKINKWCKNKPMRINKDFDITEDDKRNANYGLSIPTAKGSAEATKSDNYDYLMPRGGSSEPYRLSDFIRYDTNCIKPIKTRGAIEFNKIFNNSIMIEYFVNEVQSIYGLTIKDFKFLENCYPAIVLTDKSNGNMFWKTGSNIIGSNGAESFVIDQSETGLVQTTGKEYDYYICACGSPKTSFGDTHIGTTWFMLPNDSLSDLTGTLSFVANFPITMTPTGIASGNSVRPNLLLDIEPYIGTMPQESDDKYYFSIGTNYTPQIRYSLTNTSNETITLNKSAFRANFSRTFASVSELSAQPFSMYDGETEVQSVTIASGETKSIIFLFIDGILKMDSSANINNSVITGQKISVFISYEYSEEDTSKSTFIRFRN